MDELYNLKHEDGCRYWTHGDFCTCGADTAHELREVKAALADSECRRRVLEGLLRELDECGAVTNWLRVSDDLLRRVKTSIARGSGQ